MTRVLPSPVDNYLDSIQESVEEVKRDRYRRLLLAIARAGALAFPELVRVVGEPRLQVAMDLVDLKSSGKVRLRKADDDVTNIELTEAGRGAVDGLTAARTG